ncbi:RND family efflux transporter, MFP subunit [Desulfuromusa kysingii]|uniref:RND family efflux transporter, MFP subunit n=1 Tax=Desulfuromusa kysingii TaxID=37625 RepID=A0A1H4AZH3_9BACT|nr:efflux RND transporter periplasmic adaptor subunit [Desulfuromusa kysingii]SEA41032.1 RND family efflux transporter, MFP subunit [Desulfuromusa kysingii]
MLNPGMKFFSILAFTVLLTGSYSAAATATAPTSKVTVQIMTIQQQLLPVYATFPGRVTSTSEVQIASRLMGYIRKLPVHEGQQVKEGELLLSLDANDVKGSIAQAKAALGKSQSVLADATANYQRFLALYQQQAIPEQQFQQVEMGYRVAQGNLEAAQAGLQQAQAQLNYVDVRAPFSGTVVAKFIDVGQLAAPGHPLLTLQSSGFLQVQSQVNQQSFEQLHLEQKIPVTIDGDNFNQRPVEGTVARLVNAADPITHSHSIKLNLPVDSGATSGDFARVRIQIDQQPGIVVPPPAIQKRAGIDGVFVLDESNRAAFRMVRLGEKTATGVVVLAGLVTGDRLIVSATGELNNGVNVQISQGDGA